MIRPLPTTDLATAYELFINQAYKRPLEVPEPAPKLIVDLGANVGYSVVHWSHLYPTARLIAFEPHPQFLLTMYQNIKLNGLMDRVQIIEGAASDGYREAFLTDNENESTVSKEFHPGQITIQEVDFFSEVGGQKIDLLKMDIEGGEYDLLNDRRFEDLDVQTLVMEWHNTPKTPDGRRWCLQRLTSLGYRIAEGQLRYEKAGILWAWRQF